MPTAKHAVIAKTPRRATAKVVGSVEQAVLDETAPLVKATERPATVAGARAMARILGNDALVAPHPQAARQLHLILNELHSHTKRKSRGRLAAVQQMTKAKRFGPQY